MLLTHTHAGMSMAKIIVDLPEHLAGALDAVAKELKTSQAALVRKALEKYLEDRDDLIVATERLQDPADRELNWDEVRNKLLDTS